MAVWSCLRRGQWTFWPGHSTQSWRVTGCLRNSVDEQLCWYRFSSNYRGIKLMSHTMKRWEQVVEARLRREMTISEQQQYSFMPSKSSSDAMLALRVLMKLQTFSRSTKIRYNRVPKVELWWMWHQRPDRGPFLLAVVMDSLTLTERQQLQLCHHQLG